MIREKVLKTAMAKDHGFRWRGTDVSRIEGFSDNVFGFALTLLVVSLEVPRTFTDLQSTVNGSLGFAFAFGLLFIFWHEHYKFFRRYGMEDNTVLWLNAALLFVILFFVYPLKFLFYYLVKVFSGQARTVTMPDGSIVAAIENYQWTSLMTMYGVAFITIYAIFFLLYLHSYRKRNELELTPFEVLLTKSSIVGCGANCAIGLVSIAFVNFGGFQFAGLSGLTYVLIAPVQTVIGFMTKSRAAKFISE
ncbi:MAG: TMEM175 family protein [Bacteroidota bacterium]